MKKRNGYNSFDRDFNLFQNLFWIAWLFFAALGCGFLGFIIWVIIRLMQYFGVI